jgi:hypothetical protein
VKEPDPVAEAARIYAEVTYRELATAVCPGTEGHESGANGTVSAVYCDRCLEAFLHDAWIAGYYFAKLPR